MTRWWFRISVLAWTALLGASVLDRRAYGEPSTAGDVANLGLAATDDVLWVYHRRAEPDGTLLLRFACRRMRDGRDGAFRALRQPPISGAVVHAVVKGEDLHVFYRDGTHKRYTPAPIVWDSFTPPQSAFSERTLPLGAVPRAVSGDPVHAVLHAVITARQASAMDRIEDPPGSAASGLDESGSPGVIEPNPEPASPYAEWIRDGADLVVVRYEHGGWHPDRPIPPDVTRDAPLVSLLSRGGRIHLFYESTEKPSTLWHRVSDGSNEPWSLPESILDAPEPHLLFVGWSGENPTVFLAARGQDGFTMRSIRLVDHHWVDTFTLEQDDRPTVFSFPLSVAISGERVFVASLDENRSVSVGEWSASSGQVKEPLTRLDALTVSGTPDSPSSTRRVIEYALAGALVLAVLLWRRDGMLSVGLPSTGRTFAPIGRRAAAWLVDLAVLFPIWGAVMYGLWLRGPARTGVQALEAPQEVSDMVTWFLPILGAIFGLYASVLESITGATIGKRIAGITVTGYDGASPPWSAILFRNAIRIIEFDVPPLLLLMALTPSRQRLGDLIARTVVVMDSKFQADLPDREGEQAATGPGDVESS